MRGQNHPAPAHARALLAAAQLAQVASTALVFAGEPIVQALGLRRTPLLEQLLENRSQVMLLSFAFSNVAQNMASTGAFEIVVNGQLAYSKLKTGRLPTVEEILAVVEDLSLIHI